MDFGLTECLMVAGAALLVAGWAWFADRRRMRRRVPDAVGWVPWTGVFFWAVMVGLLALAVAVKIGK